MSLRAELIKQQTEALKAKEELRLSVLRMLWAAVKNSEIDKKEELTDQEIEQIVARQIKQSKDAIKDFSSAGRTDLVTKNEAEIKILENYLPEMMNENELLDLIKKTITELNVSQPGDVGKVMGVVMKKTAGKADGNRVRDLVSQLLSVK